MTIMVGIIGVRPNTYASATPQITQTSSKDVNKDFPFSHSKEKTKKLILRPSKGAKGRSRKKEGINWKETAKRKETRQIATSLKVRYSPA